MNGESRDPIVIYEDGGNTVEVRLDAELDELATTEDSSVVRQEGNRQVSRRIKHYNLDAIISVGYRVSSLRAVRFRQWATRILREHLTQGRTLNRQRFEANALELEAALTLLVAESDPANKETMIRLIMNMLARE